MSCSCSTKLSAPQSARSRGSARASNASISGSIEAACFIHARARSAAQHKVVDASAAGMQRRVGEGEQRLHLWIQVSRTFHSRKCRTANIWTVVGPTQGGRSNTSPAGSQRSDLNFRSADGKVRGVDGTQSVRHAKRPTRHSPSLAPASPQWMLVGWHLELHRWR